MCYILFPGVKRQNIIMGVAMHKIDALYPEHSHPTRSQFHFLNPEDKHTEPNNKQVQAQKKDDKIQPAPLQTFHHNHIVEYLQYKDIYDDFTESNYTIQQQQKESEMVKGQVQKKIIFLPTVFQGPLLLYFQKYYMNNENIDIKSVLSLSKITSKNYSRKSSMISLESRQSKDRKLQSKFFDYLKEIKMAGYLQKSKEAELKGKFEKGIKYLQKGLQLCKGRSLQLQNKETLNKVGIQTEENVENEQNKIRNRLDKAFFHKQIGRMYLQNNNLQNSQANFLKSLNSYESNSSEHIGYLIQIHKGLAAINQRKKNILLAIQHLTKAEQLQRQISSQENNPLIADLLAKIGHLYVQIGNLKKAIENYGQALYISKKSLGYDHQTVALNYYLLSLCLFEVKEYSLWLDYHCQSLKIMKKLQMSRSEQYIKRVEMLKAKLSLLIGIKNFNKDLVLKCIGLMNMILSPDDLIKFLQEIKEDIQKWYK